MASPVTDTSPTMAQSPTNPWGQSHGRNEPCSLATVMDEEYAELVMRQEFGEDIDSLGRQAPAESIKRDTPVVNEQAQPQDEGDDATSNDFLLAQMLQMEYNKENDASVKAHERYINGDNKVTMTYKNFLSTHPYDEEPPMQPYDESVESDDDDDFFWADQLDTSCQERSKGGGSTKKSEVITKHNANINKKKNATGLERFPATFASGDVSGLSGFSNKIYNDLKQHSARENKLACREHDKKEHSTHEKALDENTRLLLYKMVNSGMLESINGVISSGKEAVVIHARGGISPSLVPGKEEVRLPEECAVKVFKTTLNEFKTREKYIRDDHRFKERFSKQNPRVLIRMWAEKEFRNLKRLHDADIACPEPICLKGHLLTMAFLGKANRAAPKLKEAPLTRAQYERAYREVTQMMRDMYVKCKLIHADMSEYNVLWFDERAWIIDVSQSVEPIHPHAYQFLLRDCRNICRFFSSAGVQDVMSAHALFEFVSGKDVHRDFGSDLNLEMEGELQEFDSNKERLALGIDHNPYSFDHHFEKSTQDKLVQLQNVQTADEADEPPV